MHVDIVSLQTNGNLTISLTELLNPLQAAGFIGGTVSGSVSVAPDSSGYVTISVTVTPVTPVTEPSIQSDPGGSATIDG